MKTFKLAGSFLLAGAIALAGCSGERGPAGAQGPSGPSGPSGPPGASPAQATTESCGGCHNPGLAGHAPRNQVAVSGVSIASVASLDAVPVANADLLLKVTVKVDGVTRNDFTKLASVNKWTYDAANKGGARSSWNSTAGVALAAKGGGAYEVRLPGFGSAGSRAAAAGSVFLVTLEGDGAVLATATATVGTATHQVVSNNVCMNCHGQFVWRDVDGTTGLPSGHHGANPAGVDGCVVCHNRVDTSETRLGTATAITNGDPANGNRLPSNTEPVFSATLGTAPGSRLMGYVHGIHNSHNMSDGVYSRNGSTSATSQFSIGFPGYMNNCSTCHDTAASLAAVTAAPVSWQLCISCHDSAAGLVAAGAPTVPNFTGALDHATFTAATNCGTCHGGQTVNNFHNGLKTERAGLIWDGADVSVTEGAKIQLAITGVTVSGTQMTVTWTAKQNGADVNPCNTDVATGPVFFGVTANAATGQVGSNMSLLRGYAQGNDWVNAGVGSSPGQPSTAQNLGATAGTNIAVTTCAANVATSVMNVETTIPAGVQKGVVALQGKPQITFAGNGKVIQVRAKTPTREFDLATGQLPSDVGQELRREIVSIDKCLACHKGSVYQHGGNRVDNDKLCVMCHNAASSEKNNRVGMGVDESEAYDGKTGQTYDLRTMLHSIHSAGETGAPLVYYRSNGIYLFGTKAALAKVTNWPTTGGVTCKNAEGNEVTYYKVAGSTATGTVPEANPDGTCKTSGLANSADGTWRIHNFIEVHYPRALNDCAACHVNGSELKVPDATQAVGVTFDPGAAPWGNQIDDVLVGPAAASCMSCHRSGDPLGQWNLDAHAQGEGRGWVPTTFEAGRQTLIDAAQ